MAPLRLLQQAGQGVDRCRGRPSTQHMHPRHATRLEVPSFRPRAAPASPFVPPGRGPALYEAGGALDRLNFNWAPKMGKGSGDPPGSALHITVGSHVFLWREGDWAKGQVVAMAGPKLRVRLEDGAEQECAASDIPLRNSSAAGVEVSAEAVVVGRRVAAAATATAAAAEPAYGWAGVPACL